MKRTLEIVQHCNMYIFHLIPIFFPPIPMASSWSKLSSWDLIFAWVVKVTTGSISTNDHVKIQLKGDQGSSDLMEMDDYKNNFETDK